jgi:uncharacterized membrane protein
MALTAGILGLGSIVVVLIGILANLVLPGIGSACGCGLGLLMGIVGLILGIIGQAQIKNRPGEKGKGMAVTGIIIGILSVLAICVIPVVLVLGGGAILTFLGPQIGNIFTQITSALGTPPAP